MTDTPKSLANELVLLLPQLQRRALYLTRDEAAARDLVQESLERALRFEHSYQEGTNLKAWTLCILKNAFLSQKRRESAYYRAVDQLIHQTEYSSEPVLGSLSPKIRAALSALPERLSRVVELVDLFDYTYQEAATELGVPVGTIMSRLFRARARLRASCGAIPASGALAA